MSYKFGLNGNDLNWDKVTCLNSMTLELEQAILEGVAELDEDGNVTDQYYQSVSDMNPTIIYYSGEVVELKDVKESDKPFLEFVPWFLIHDTNDNSVQFEGDIPDEYLTDEYIQERDKEKDIEAVWLRLGVTVKVDARLFKMNPDEAVRQALLAGKAEVDGDSYIPSYWENDIEEETIILPCLKLTATKHEQ